MSATIRGIVVASIAVFLWGFLYWGANPVPYMAWEQAPDDRAAGQALLEHFPESGVYYLPGNGNPPELRAALYESGPTGFVIIDRNGRPEMDPSIMMQGFALNVLIICLLAGLLHVTASATPSWGERFRVTLLAGAVAVTLVDFGHAVWWLIPWPWVLAQAFYDFTAVALMGAILAYFIRDPAEG